MSVIKGCLKEDSKELKKLVMMYWEVVKKYDAEGKLLPEMILVRACLHRCVCAGVYRHSIKLRASFEPNIVFWEDNVLGI